MDFVQIYRQVSFCFHFPSEAKKKSEGITCNLRKGRQSTERKKRNCLQGTCSASNHMLAMPIILEGSTCLDEARWSGVSGVLLAAVSCVPAWKSKRKAHPLSLSLSLSLCPHHHNPQRPISLRTSSPYFFWNLNLKSYHGSPLKKFIPHVLIFNYISIG